MGRDIIQAIAIISSLAGGVVILKNPPIKDIDNDGIEDLIMLSLSTPTISLGKNDGSYYTTRILQERDSAGKRIEYFIDSEGTKWIYNGQRKLATRLY